jgi:hypothetical protein
MINIRDTALQSQNLVRAAIIVIIAIVSRYPARAPRGEWIFLGANPGGRKPLR